MSVTFTLQKNINFDQVDLSPTSRSFVDAEDILAAFIDVLMKKESQNKMFFHLV